MTNLEQSGLAAFSPRARLLRLIGSDLISDEVVAITELVKNAHDADASKVAIEFLGVTGDDGEILVRDDGHGMDLETLLTRWMQPASSNKGREGARVTTLGRRVLGEKGVGRFAADKLASRLELVSRRSGEHTEIHAIFNWDDFSSDETMLSDVRSRWRVRPPEWLERSGTVLRLMSLKTRWNERLFRRLSSRLSRLISPFGDRSGFSIRIESDEFPEYAGDVAGFLDHAPYRIEAEFDSDRTITFKVNGARTGRVDWPGEGRPTCGPLRARLFAFDLETEALARIGPRSDVRAWLREWSGVSVYRDGFRIWPYGEPHDDWLRLDQRRVNNPVIRLSNNQLVGFVEISADRNPELRDQTNREGLIHNEPFEDLQRFILCSIQMLEAERQAQRHPGGRTVRAKGQQSMPEEDSVIDALEALASRAGNGMSADLKRLASRARAQAAAQEASRRRMLEGYSALASAGQLASTVNQSVGVCLDGIRDLCARLRAVGGGKTADAALAILQPALDRLDPVLELATEQIARVSVAPAGGGQRRRGLDVPGELHRLKYLLMPLLEKDGATLDIEVLDGTVPRIEMRPEMFMALSSAMVKNSLDWVSEDRPLRINVTIRASDDVVEIVFADNGKGVVEPLREKLFEPMVSGREDRAGMGLTLVRNAVTAHGGEVALLQDRRRRGAAFRVVLPRKRSRAT